MALDRRMTDQEMRSEDHNDEIASLIKEEDDPKNRAFLIILQNINLSLIANTRTVSDIDKQLKAHLVEFKERAKTEDARLNRGIGAWRVMVGIVGIAQLIILGVVNYGYTELKALHDADVEIAMRLTVLEHRGRPDNGDRK